MKQLYEENGFSLVHNEIDNILYVRKEGDMIVVSSECDCVYCATGEIPGRRELPKEIKEKYIFLREMLK